MSKQRLQVPRAIRTDLLDEFNHRCAVCGTDRPQVHHIDENPSNNDPFNLIPLCPNCHLVDQHNPTVPIDPRKLKLFRIYKDPTILKPQFHPLFTRMLFLDSIDDQQPVKDIENQATELVEFVRSLAMGSFYGARLYDLLRRKHGTIVQRSLHYPDSRAEQQRSDYSQAYREQVRGARDSIHTVIVELLRYQDWK
jgi:hypothetical protein